MSEDGKSQEVPPGFHIVVLPYRDDIRAPPKIITGSEDIGQLPRPSSMREADDRDGTAGIDDGENRYEIEIKAWLLQSRRLS